MQVRLGYEIAVEASEPMPMVLSLDIRDESRGQLSQETGVLATPNLPSQIFRDMFGNTRRRVEVPRGCLTLFFDAVADLPDGDFTQARRGGTPVTHFLQDSPYCDVQARKASAHDLFGGVTETGAKVEAICAHVRRATRVGIPETDGELALHEAIAWCRATGIAARFVRGFGGVPTPAGFSTWFEAYLGGRWFPFDIEPVASGGRLAVARGRDAGDVVSVSAPKPFRTRGVKVWFFRQDAAMPPGPGTRQQPEAELNRAA